MYFVLIFFWFVSVVFLGKPFCHLKNTLFFLFFIVDDLRKDSCHVLDPRSCHLEGSVPPFSRFGEQFSHLGAPRRTILAPWHHLAGPWEKQDGFEMVVYKILLDSGVPILKVLGAEACNLNFCRFVSRSLFIDFWVGVSILGAPKSRLSLWMYCKKQLLT